MKWFIEKWHEANGDYLDGTSESLERAFQAMTPVLIVVVVAALATVGLLIIVALH